MKFPDLVTHIAEIDHIVRISSGRLLQQALSLRNWIIGVRLGLLPVTQRSGIRQTSAESAPLPFPGLAERAAGHMHLPWRDSAWLTRLFTELTFSHLLEM